MDSGFDMVQDEIWATELLADAPKDESSRSTFFYAAAAGVAGAVTAAGLLVAHKRYSKKEEDFMNA